MARPNLFDFATSELSQDAFLCWLIANAGHEEDAALHGVGRAFIAWLWSACRGQPVSPADVRLLEGPLCQVDHIDILFEAEVCGRRVVFVVEDKTDTSQHSGQLERYKQAVSGRASEIVLVYFKTGYHFGIDKEAAALGYAVIGLREWVAFLKEHAVPSEVFRDYLSYASRLLEERETAIVALHDRGGHVQFREDYVQFEFIQQLASRCPETLAGSAIHRGMNMGGTPWTHYRFAWFERALPGGIGEVLFHRVDARNDGGGTRRYYLSTRQHAVVKGNAARTRARSGSCSSTTLGTASPTFWRSSRSLTAHSWKGFVDSPDTPEADRGRNAPPLACASMEGILLATVDRDGGGR